MPFAFSFLRKMQIEPTEFQEQLVGGLAHRMNNILTLFHGYLGLLLDNKKLDRATQEGLTKIKDGARAASELMDRTHSLVRASAVVSREVDLGEFLQLLRPGFDAFRQPRTTIELNCPAGLPKIWADMGKLRVAIAELVRNACEAIGTTGGTVQIELQGDAAAPVQAKAGQPIRWVSLTITDNGPGIPFEISEKIFTPFFTMKKKQNAAGLGLTLALGFVQQLGGVIRLQSEPGRTAVQMLLPSGRATQL